MRRKDSHGQIEEDPAIGKYGADPLRDQKVSAIIAQLLDPNDPEVQRDAAEERWWRHELRFLMILTDHPQIHAEQSALPAAQRHPLWRPGGNRRSFDNYVVATQQHHRLSFTGRPIPPYSDGGTWWSRFARAALIASGHLRSTSL